MQTVLFDVSGHRLALHRIAIDKDTRSVHNSIMQELIHVLTLWHPQKKWKRALSLRGNRNRQTGYYGGLWVLTDFRLEPDWPAMM